MTTNTDQPPDVPAVEIITAPPEPPPPPAPPSPFIRVAMPRVKIRVLQDYSYEAISLRVHHARQPLTISDALGGVYRAGALLAVDQYVVDQLSSPPPMIGPIVEVLETLEETVERSMLRLNGQQGDACSYAEYKTLRDRLVEQHQIQSHWQWVSGEAL